MYPKKTHHTEAEPETDSRVCDIKEHIWAMESGRTDIPSQSGHCPLFVHAHLQSKLLVYKTNCLVMQVSREASLLSPGAKFNKPLDSWSFCFKIWGHYFWPVNHQLSALPSKILKKINKKKWQLLVLKHPCIPAAAAWFSTPEGKWEKPCTAELCQHTGKVHL